MYILFILLTQIQAGACLSRRAGTGLLPSIIGRPWPGEFDLDADEVFQYPDSSVYEWCEGSDEEEEEEMGDGDQNVVEEQNRGLGEGDEEVDEEYQWFEDGEDLREGASVGSKDESLSEEVGDDSERSEGKYPKEEREHMEEEMSGHESIENMIGTDEE